MTGTLGCGVGLDQDVIEVAFALVLLARPANVDRTLFNTISLRRSSRVAISIRHYIVEFRSPFLKLLRFSRQNLKIAQSSAEVRLKMHRGA